MKRGGVEGHAEQESSQTTEGRALGYTEDTSDHDRVTVTRSTGKPVSSPAPVSRYRWKEARL